MNSTINSKSFYSEFGIIISKTQGLWDFLERKGETYQSFLDENGIDPFVNFQDIKYKHRTIVLDCFLQADGASDFQTKLDAFKKEIQQSGLQTLALENDSKTRDVFLKDPVQVKLLTKWKASGKMIAKFNLKLIEPKPIPSYAVTFIVENGSGNKIENAEVTFNGITQYTDSSGETSFDMKEGTYDYTVSKPNYESSSGSIVVDSDTTKNITLSASGNTITFAVEDDSGSSLQGADVTFDGETKTTDSNGNVSFIRDDGTYNYSVSLNGYESASGSLSVSSDTTESVTLNELHTVTFTVERSADASRVSGLDVDFNGSTKTTDSNGQVSFDVPDGSYTVNIDATSYYQSHSESISVSGLDVSKTITLDKKSDVALIQVTDIDTSDPIEDIEVTMNGTTNYTDSEGKVMFAGLTDGTDYNISFVKSGYDSYSTTLTFDPAIDVYSYSLTPSS